MIDTKILDATGLSEHDAADLINKFQAFAASLNPAQLAAFATTQPAAAEVAKAVSAECTAEDLNAFISKRCEGLGSPIVMGVPLEVTDEVK